MARLPPSDPVKFHEAVREFRKKDPLPDSEWDALEAAEREYAFKVSGVAQADMVQEVWDAIDRAVDEGTTFAEFKDDVGEMLEDAWGGADAARLETVFRTNVMTSYSHGRYDVMTDPDVKEARPFWRFDAVIDDRTTDVCDELNGTILPADDPFWDTHTPPMTYNCRSILTPLSADEAEEEGVADKAPEHDADEGFGGAPDDNEAPDWDPDSRDYAPEIGEILNERLR